MSLGGRQTDKWKKREQLRISNEEMLKSIKKKKALRVIKDWFHCSGKGAAFLKLNPHYFMHQSTDTKAPAGRRSSVKYHSTRKV